MDPDDNSSFDLLHWKDGWGPLDCPDYSTSIAAAWAVVEKLRTTGFTLHVSCFPNNFQMCFFHGGRNDYSEADTAPLAICLAALKAVGYKED